MANPNINYLQEQPMDIQVEILSNLDPKDLINVCQVNKSGYKTYCNPELWKRLVKKHFGDVINNNYSGESEHGIVITNTNNWYDTYKLLYNKIDSLAVELINKYNTTNPKYLNNNLYRDIYEVLRSLTEKYYNELIDITEDDFAIDYDVHAIYSMIIGKLNVFLNTPGGDDFIASVYHSIYENIKNFILSLM
jgi:hypothetical protein